MSFIPYSFPGDLLIILGIVAAIVLIFLILRELVTWYWKINETIDVLRDINHNLHRIATALSNSKEVKKENSEVVPAEAEVKQGQ